MTTPAARSGSPRRLPLAPEGGAPSSPGALPEIAVDRAEPKLARVSLTDRCDLACVYCRPHRHDGYFEKRLSAEEWDTVFKGLALSGIERVRITGGEPLLHKDVVALVRSLAALPLTDLALTTNATRLAPLASELKAAGLRRITISLDTLDAEKFRRLTRGGDLDEVLRGIDAAVEAGFPELKLNTVVLRGENDDELESLVRFAWARGITPRFIELMPIGEGARIQDQLVTAKEMMTHLAHLFSADEGARDPERGPAKYLRSKDDPSRRVGFITGTSDTYCKGCDRLRVASNGTIRPCLATNDGLSPASALLRKDPQAFAQAVHAAWELKPDASFKGCTEATAKDVSIRAIGG